MNWIQRKIYLYNVTFGLYMLDWWERFLFNSLVAVLMWFVCYNGVRYATEFCKRCISANIISAFSLGTLEIAVISSFALEFMVTSGPI